MPSEQEINRLALEAIEERYGKEALARELRCSYGIEDADTVSEVLQNISTQDAFTLEWIGETAGVNPRYLAYGTGSPDDPWDGWTEEDTAYVPCVEDWLDVNREADERIRPETQKAPAEVVRNLPPDERDRNFAATGEALRRIMKNAVQDKAMSESLYDTVLNRCAQEDFRSKLVRLLRPSRAMTFGGLSVRIRATGCKGGEIIFALYGKAGDGLEVKSGLGKDGVPTLYVDLVTDNVHRGMRNAAVRAVFDALSKTGFRPSGGGLGSYEMLLPCD